MHVFTVTTSSKSVSQSEQEADEEAKAAYCPVCFFLVLHYMTKKPQKHTNITKLLYFS